MYGFWAHEDVNGRQLGVLQVACVLESDKMLVVERLASENESELEKKFMPLKIYCMVGRNTEQPEQERKSEKNNARSRATWLRRQKFTHACMHVYSLYERKRESRERK